MPRVSALLVWLVLPFVSLPAADAPLPTSIPWSQQALPREELAAENNVLTRWRPLLPALFPEAPAVGEQLRELSSPLNDFPLAPAAAELETWLAAFAPTLAELTFRNGEALQLPPLLGPETPFPDHQPLRQLAHVRTGALKLAWRDERHSDAVALALENLALARAFLTAQEGLIPLINAVGIWQLSLDGVYWLTLQPELTPDHAARLQLALLTDDRLAADALMRAFRGEFTFFTQTTIERLPRTHDVELFLSSIGSLGLAPPHAPAEGTPRLAIPERLPFDRDATLQAAADDVQGWVTAFAAASRHPRGLAAAHTYRQLETYAREIRELWRYSVQDAPPTTEQALTVDAEIAAVENPVGKLFLIITTSQWEPISVSVFRREAHRSALTGMLAWRRLGRPATWKELVIAGLLPADPADPFSSTSLHWKAEPPRIWSVGENGTDEGGEGDGENLGRPADLVWPLSGPLSNSETWAALDQQPTAYVVGRRRACVRPAAATGAAGGKFLQ